MAGNILLIMFHLLTMGGPLEDSHRCQEVLEETGVAREAGKRVVVLDVGAIPVITADHYRRG